MKRYHKMTPEGTRDYLFEECRTIKQVSQRSVELFADHGYHEVMTPTIEYYDVFQNGNSGIAQESSYKLVDPQGRILVLRPDNTFPAARFTATRLKDALMPIRLCYSQNVFRMNRGMSGRSNEIIQSGIELLGASGLLADMEVLCLAVKALETTGTKDFRIELGHAGLFGRLVDVLELQEDLREELRFYIESKNDSMLGNLLAGLGDRPEVHLLHALPFLYGGAEILDKAEAYRCETAAQPLAYLRKVYQTLSALSLDANLQIDLGLVYRDQYYTGLVFRGYMEGSGDAVISGGRYDNLLKEFGTPLPAIGFALDVNAIVKALLQTGEMGKTPAADVLIAVCPGYETQALHHYQTLQQDGLICELLAVENAVQAKSHAQRRGIRRIDFIEGAIKTYSEEKDQWNH